MSKTITLRLSDENYKVYKKLADRDNRPISNFIETAVKRFIEHNTDIDEFEMEEIRNNTELNKSLKRGLADMKSKKGKEYARLNMPFELGIDFGMNLLQKKGKKYLILEDEKYSYQKGLSDYAGFDIYAHHNDPDALVKILRDWFVNNRIINSSTPSPNKIYLDYFDCWAFIYDSLILKGYAEDKTDDIPINEFIDLVKEWKGSITAA